MQDEFSCDITQAFYMDKETSGRITIRAVVIGLILIPVTAYWVGLTEIRLACMFATSFSLFQNVVFVIFILILFNFLLKRILPMFALRQGELLIIYIMLCIPTALMGEDMVRILITTLGHATFFATPENEWADLFHKYIPDWFAVKDNDVLRGFHEGSSTFWTIEHIKGWFFPLIFWFGLLFALFFVMLCINLLFRKQWVEYEKLSFPIIQLPMEMTSGGGNTQIFKNRLMWLGFGIAAMVVFSSAINQFYPNVPPLRIRLYDVGHYFTAKPWDAIGWTPVALPPFAVGLIFFVPLNLSFSCWIFYILKKVQMIATGVGGYRAIQGAPYFIEQRTGAWIGMYVAAMWVGKAHLKNFIKIVLGRGEKRNRLDEAISSRSMLFGIVGGIALIMFLCHRAGLSLWVAGSVFFIYIAVLTAITKVRAQLGPPMHGAFYVHPEGTLVKMVGTRALGNKNLTIVSYFYWFARAYRCHPMQHQLEALKIGTTTRMNSKVLFWVIILATGFSILICFWTILDISYRWGSSLMGNSQIYMARETFVRLQGWLFNPRGTETVAVVFMGIGFSFLLFLMAMMRHFLWWPLHPIGYLMAEHYTMDWLWFSFLMVWIVKRLALRQGGVNLYRKISPFFLGLILGNSVASCIVGTISLIIGRPIDTSFIS